MLTVRHLRKLYDRDLVLDDVNFEVRRGEFVSIVGPSGCGKTTLLKCVCGLLPPTAGEVMFAGSRVSGPPREMALVFQEYGRSLYPWMTVGANVAFPLKRKSLSRQQKDALVHRALHSVGLLEAEHKYPWQLSGGMQQRVAIARALAYEPQMLVMDEPFASVDAQTRADLEDLVLSVRQEFGMTILLVTHDIDESVYLSDRIVALSIKPTVVTTTFDVPLPLPRDQVVTKEDPVFAHLRADVWKAIKRNESPSRSVASN